MEDERSQVEPKDRKEQKDEDRLVESGLHSRLKESDGAFQGQKLGADTLAFLLHHEELLDLGYRVDQIFRLPFAASRHIPSVIAEEAPAITAVVFKVACRHINLLSLFGL